jgi:hypothetical protein
LVELPDANPSQKSGAVRFACRAEASPTPDAIRAVARELDPGAVVGGMLSASAGSTRQPSVEDFAFVSPAQDSTVVGPVTIEVEPDLAGDAERTSAVSVDRIMQRGGSEVS